MKSENRCELVMDVMFCWHWHGLQGRKYQCWRDSQKYYLQMSLSVRTKKEEGCLFAPAKMGMAIFSMLYTATCQMSSHSSTRTPGKAIVFSLLLKPIPTRVPFSTWYLKSRTCPTYGAKVSNFSSEPKTVIKNEKISVRMKN